MLLGRQLRRMSAILPPIPVVSGRRIQIFVNTKERADRGILIGLRRVLASKSRS